MTLALLPVPLFKATDANGLPLALGKLYSYAANSSTPQALLAADGTTPLANPVILDASGQAELRLGPNAYKLDLYSALDVQQSGWPVDNVSSLAPTVLGDYSATVAQMKLSTDPGELGSESLATSEAGELERLRFAIYDDKHALDPHITQWYETPYGPGWRNVKGYGAVGDDSHDDTAAFQAALTAGGMVVVPPGRYKITSTLTITVGVHLRGIGPGPGGVTTGTTTDYPGVILNHAFNGTFFDILGTDTGTGATLEAAVGTRLENLILRNSYGDGTGDCGTAIRFFCTSNTHKASWLRLKDVNCEVVTGPSAANDWTYCLDADGDNTSSYTAAAARDLWLEGGRFWADTHSTGCFRFHCVVNCFMFGVFLNGTAPGLTLTGADANHRCSNVRAVACGLGSVTVDYCDLSTFAACALSSLTISANATSVGALGTITTYPAIDAANTTCWFLGNVAGDSSLPEFAGGTGGLKVRTTDRQAVLGIDAADGYNALLKFMQAGTSVWDVFRNDGDSDNLWFNSATKSGVLALVAATGVLKPGYALAEKKITLTYSAAIAVDASQGNWFKILVTDANAFTIGAPSNMTDGQTIEFLIANISGGAMGAITWTSYNLAGAFTNPASAKNRSIIFRNDNGSVRESARTAADVAN